MWRWGGGRGGPFRGVQKNRYHKNTHKKRLQPGELLPVILSDATDIHLVRAV